ncbi:MAG: hypothetical protein XXXJIFNMEKO3_02676 [Candidatus Erwinia impunctatus]
MCHYTAWMQQAVKQGTFDEVTTPEMKLEVRAGDAVGFLSKDIDPVGMGKVESSHFVHIEVISNDTRMPAFLDNPGGVTTGRQYIRIHSGKSIYQKTVTDEAISFTAMSCAIVRDSGKILPADKCNPLKDAEGQTWYEISSGSWMNENDVDVLHQYDLKARGFTALEQAVTPDMSDSLREGWMKSLLSELSARVNSARGVQQKQVADYYQKAVGKLDTDGDGELSTEELFYAVHHPEMEIRDIAGKMVVRHGSEWFGGSSHHKWTKYFQDFELPRVRYARQWRDDMEWMSHVEAFKSGAPVWHMHPVMFLGGIAVIDDEMDLKWLQVPKGQLTFDAEGNDNENSIYFSRYPHVPNNGGVVIGASCVTFGRGLDFGQQSRGYINNLFSDMERNTNPLSGSLKNWLLGSVGLQGEVALIYCRGIDENVPFSERFLTRKQQYFLFNAVYEYKYKVTKRVLSNGVNINDVDYSANLDAYNEKIKDVIVDLTFRGDNTNITRRYFILDLINGSGSFKSNISNLDWRSRFGVPLQRFNSRKRYL